MDLVLQQLDQQSDDFSYKMVQKHVGDETLSAVVVTMPDEQSKLLYIPLPKVIEERAERYCMDDEMGIYHHVKPSAMYALQPRRTICYSHVYNYSKTVHPVEPTTPARIVRLYDVTNELFNLGDGVNMDLANFYSNGRQSISAHSDNEKQFGNLRDVFCWVFGPARRLGIFRSIHDDAGPLRLQISQGLYVMRGLSFQKNYTHEFPELYPALFKRLRKGLIAMAEELEFPVDVPQTELGANQESLVQADWIKTNRKKVRKLIAKGTFSKGKKIGTDLEKFEEWCLERTSHTLRQFVNK